MDGMRSNVLAIPGIVSRTRLDLPPEMSLDDWQNVGRALVNAEQSLMWWLGDWWHYGEHKYGERAQVVRDWEGPAFQTCVNASKVCKRFETNRRRLVLSFSHHAEVASLPPEQADALLDTAENKGWSTRELRSAVSRAKVTIGEQPSDLTCTVKDLDVLVSSGRKFGTIYADPPWRYDNQGTRAATSNHYDGMTVPELCSLPVEQLASEDAHLHLWTTNGFLFQCAEIFDAWGFEFRSSFVWVKPQIGIGNYWRNSHEFLLTAIRGNAKRFNDKSLKSWLECDRGAHSAKPEQVRSYIEKASPGPFLELFGRAPITGWAVFGNQIERNLFHQSVASL